MAVYDWRISASSRSEKGAAATREAVLLKEVMERLRSGREAGRPSDPEVPQPSDYCAERCVLPTAPVQSAHREQLETDHV